MLTHLQGQILHQVQEGMYTYWYGGERNSQGRLTTEGISEEGVDVQTLDPPFVLCTSLYLQVHDEQVEQNKDLNITHRTRIPS